jgi:glycosyltransferase involved in cell wall biosynthesis
MAGGGAERQLVYLAGELTIRGWEVHVALLKEGPNYEGLISTASIIHKIPASGNYDIAIFWRLMRLIHAVRPDIVQTWLTQMDVLGGIASKLTGIPFLLTERSCEHNYPSNFKNRLRKFIGRFASAIVSNSPEGDRYWRNRLGDSTPRHVVPNAVPLKNIEKAGDLPLGFHFAADCKVLLFAGRFSPEKNIGTIIRAFKNVLNHQDAVLLLCGEGSDRPQVEEIIRGERLRDHIIIVGYVHNLWPLMKRADLFISLSAFEGQPNAVLEAMACGCPLILSDIPAHRAFLDQQKATFVNPTNLPEIVDAILFYLQNPKRAREMALRAKSGVSTFSIRAVADKYENIYHSLLSS